jgi:hypothetical protein
MAQLWNRKAVVTMGPKGEEGVRIEGLRVSFDIVKTNKKSANNAKIVIYNLNESNKSILKTKEDISLMLEVGYGSNVDLLFTGDVVRSSTQRNGADFLTTIEIEDGDQALTTATIDKSYVAGTDLKTVVDDALQSMKDAGQVIIGSVNSIKDDIAQNGFTASGLASKVIDEITKKQGLEFSIQDNETQILGESEDTGEEAIVLTPSTGLIGSPRIGLIGKEAAKVDGIEFKALIQTTRFKPGRVVQIKSREVDGFFKILKSKFMGDTHAPAWFVNCEGKTI